MDPITIATGAQGIAAAIDIGRRLVSGVGKLEGAEARLALADLMTQLASARLDAIAAQELIGQKDAEIARLKDCLHNKDAVVKIDDAYYVKDAYGRPTGDPLCVACVELKGHNVHLTRGMGSWEQMVCPSCKHEVLWTRAQLPEAKAGAVPVPPSLA